MIKGLKNPKRNAPSVSRKAARSSSVNKNETTPQDFALFKNEILKWIKVLGLNNWEIYFSHSNIEHGDVLATTSWSLTNRSVTFTLSKDWADHARHDQEEIKMTALHEVLHLLLARLTTLARHRFIREEEILDSIHEVVSILGELLYNGKN